MLSSILNLKIHNSSHIASEHSLGADEDDEEALMQRALELSLKDMSTEEVATYNTNSTNMDTQVTSGSVEAEEDEVRAMVDSI